MSDNRTDPPRRRRVNRLDFGSVRELPSGRWQARYPDEAGRPMKAPQTFGTKADALAHIAAVRTDRLRGKYIDPRRGETLFGPYAKAWIDNGGSRGHLAAGTERLYRDLLGRHLEPVFGPLALGAIKPGAVREWHTALLRGYAANAKKKTRRGTKRIATGDARVRQAYALLRAILSTAEGDELIGRNPCRLKGAGVARSPERPWLSLTDFQTLVDAHPEHLRAALHMVLGAHLRLGELIGLQRRDLDLEAGTLAVVRQIAEDGDEPTSTKGGTASRIDLPAVTVEMMRDYLASIPKAMPRTALFITPAGVPITRAHVTRAWVNARAAVELPKAHLHDVRHLGLTLSAQSGATIAELRQRARHSTNAAAMVYQHAAEERGKIVAAAYDAAIRSGSA